MRNKETVSERKKETVSELYCTVLDLYLIG